MSEHPELPKSTGKIRNLEKFDAAFFAVPAHRVDPLDPMCRMMLEHSWEAIMDAGINPRQLRGKKIAVIVSVGMCESEMRFMTPDFSEHGVGILDISRSHYSNYISYCFDFNGPSYSVNTGCSSSLTGIENAFRAIKSGQCEGAIVGGLNLCLSPYLHREFYRSGVLSPGCRSKSFDESADGYVRSEAISAVFLQNKENAKRIYATIANAKVNSDGFKLEGMSYPFSQMQAHVMKECYEECNLTPACVKFVEAHGTGTKVGDPVEVGSMEMVFCKDIERSEPLLIGSIKSNLGHTEVASGVVSLTKVVLGMNSGVIFPNLHFNRARKEYTAINEGKMKVVTEVTPWDGEYAALNSFGVGGSNAHVILKSNDKKKINGAVPTDGVPRLVTISGRNAEAVQTFFDDLKGKPIDSEYVGLLHNIFSCNIPGNLFRGYILLDQNESTNDRPQMIVPFDGEKRPVWFVFSGMGSQWSGMGESLLRLPLFAETVRKCDAVLKPRGVDIYDVLASKDRTIFDNILNSFVGITVIQIALVDVLYALNLTPDNVVGHSLGEHVCAYATGGFTLEQTVLSSYYRGLVSIETELIHGSMAAVGLGHKKLEEMCPQDIFVACHNSADNSTISGPTASVEAFIRELEAKNIFVKKVETGDIAYHSHYVEALCPKFLALMKECVPHPKTRDGRWISTSVPKDDWNNASAQLSSAEYFTNNLKSPVLFEEMLDMIPADAITIEIAPHGLLQAILKRALKPSITNLPLTLRGHSNNLNFFLESIGKLFNSGIQPDIAKLYPRIEFPVSCGTQSISHLIRWEHSNNWHVSKYGYDPINNTGERFVHVSLSNPKYSSLAGHVVDGLNLFPATGYIQLVWETIAHLNNKYFTDFPVLFKDVQFSRATIIPKKGEITFRVNIHIGGGKFEVAEGKTTVASGFVYDSSHPEAERLDLKFENSADQILKSEDIYKKSRIAGCHYTGVFRSIKSSDIAGSTGRITWQDNWVAYLDNVLQFTAIGVHLQDTFVPVGIDSVFIDPKYHINALEPAGEEKELSVHVNKAEDLVISGGVEVRGVRANLINRRRMRMTPSIEEYRFVPFEDADGMPISETLRTVCQIVYENHRGIHIEIAESMEGTHQVSKSQIMSPLISAVFEDMPAVLAKLNIITSDNGCEDDPDFEGFQIVPPREIQLLVDLSMIVGHGLLRTDRQDYLSLLISRLAPQGFLLTRETGDSQKLKSSAQSRNLDVILQRKSGEEILLLLRKRAPLVPNQRTRIISVTNDKFDWVEKMRNEMKENVEQDKASSFKIILVGQSEIDNGLMGLVKCLRQEPGGEAIRGILIQDPKAMEFDPDNPFYAEHLFKDLSLSVLRENGTWGCYTHLPIPKLRAEPHHHAMVRQLVPGDLSSFEWIGGPINKEYDSENLIRVVYVALNFRDIMLSTGRMGNVFSIQEGMKRLPDLAVEFSGYNAAGEPVMGYAERSCLTNLFETDPKYTFKIPTNWTLEEGATVFTAYSTAYYALFVRGRMQKGDKVLIHAGSGGLGQAAIRLALYEQCEVFTTVGNPEKRKFIKNLFPEIGDDHIGNSRDTSFRRMIKKVTNGVGVDIVLNSLAEEKLLASVDCLARGGRFLEVGKYDLAKNSHLGMKIFLKDVSFHGIQLDEYLCQSDEHNAVITQYMLRGLRNGAIQPITRTIFARNEIEAAFRSMTAGKHVGKVLLKIRDEDETPNSTIDAVPRYYCSKDRSYIVLGGLGGVGLELVDWLISRGARNVVISSRSGVKAGYQKMKIRNWEKCKARILVISEKDASIYEDCKFILEAASQLAPVDGIFNLALVLKDALWENQTAESFEEVFKCKANATINLDSLSRTMCPLLKNFVVFSSVACGRGNAGQSNYGMANAVMERICERRASEGLPAQAIQWGPIGDVGVISRLDESAKEVLKGLGLSIQGISSCLKELDQILVQDMTIVSCMILSEKNSNASTSHSVLDTVMNIMGLNNLAGMSVNTPLSELGLDSMMAVEIKQTLERVHGIFLTVQELRSLNFKKLQEMSTNNSPQQNQSDPLSQDISPDHGRLSLLFDLRDLLLSADTVDAHVEYELCPLSASADEEIFLVPGVTGFGSVFQPLVPNLKPSATCLQLGFEMAEVSIESMARRFLQDVYNRCKTKKKFVLVGYSFGSMIAMELSRLLEEMGLQGILVLIEGSPEYIKNITSSAMDADDQTYDSLQNNILLFDKRLSSPEDHAKLLKALGDCQEWEDKLQAYFDIFSSPRLGISVEYQKNCLRSIYARLRAGLDYSAPPARKIKAPIVLIKSIEPSVQIEAEDYGLSKTTESLVRVLGIDKDHTTIVQDSVVADIINDVAQEHLRSPTKPSR